MNRLVFFLSLFLTSLLLSTFIHAQSCFDSDGLNYYKKGYVMFDDTVYYDNCVNKRVLIEGYCSGNYFNTMTHYCPSDCSNGSCINPPCKFTQDSWEKVTNYSPGEDAIRRVATDSQGNIIAVGWDYINVIFNWRVIKYDSLGRELWMNTSFNARANDVAIDSQDNVIVVGYSGIGTASKWKIMKFNPSGSVIWDKIISYNGGSAWVVATDSQDNIIVGGIDNAPGNYEWRIVKYNSVGVMLWENVTNYGLTAGDQIFGVATDSQNNIIVGGFTSDTVGNNDQWRTMKYNSAGVMLWTNATDYSSGNDMIRDVEVDSQDNIIVVGNDVIPGNNEWRIVKFNSAGSVLWENVTDYTSNGDISYGVGVDTKNNIIVAGIENSFVGGDSKMRVMKYSSAGSELWSNAVNPTTGDDQFYDATSDLEDSMILGGYDSLSGKEWRIMKYSFTGTDPICDGRSPETSWCDGNIKRSCNSICQHSDENCKNYGYDYNCIDGKCITCTGTISLSLSRNPALVNEKVTATISGLSGCDGKNVYVSLIQGTEELYACNCILSGNGCPCPFNALYTNTGPSYNYIAKIDKNGNGVYEADEKSFQTLYVQCVAVGQSCDTALSSNPCCSPNSCLTDYTTGKKICTQGGGGGGFKTPIMMMNINNLTVIVVAIAVVILAAVFVVFKSFAKKE